MRNIIFPSQISEKDRVDFYTHKYQYYRIMYLFTAYSVILSNLGYFVTDCQIFNRFAWETVIPRFSNLLLIPVIAAANRHRLGYRWMSLLGYLVAHVAMWTTIWAIWFLPDRQFAREGFIIMHFAFLAFGFAAPYKYHIIAHSVIFLNIIVSDLFIHYETYQMMLTLALPVYLGILVVLKVVEDSYARYYLLMKKLADMSYHDQLTGAYNRNKLTDLLRKIDEPATASQAAQVLIMDIDFFKKVNDTYGHVAGDQVLITLSHLIQEQKRPSDVLIRWGGEEFVVIMPKTDPETGRAKAEKIRQAVAAVDTKVCPITVSMGLAEYHAGEDFRVCINRADQALYWSKEHGRNQVTRIEDIPSMTAQEEQNTSRT
jgi:diguanylate cyclase (GGDEF)-like protein